MYKRYLQSIEHLKTIGNYRILRQTDSHGKQLTFQNKSYLNLSSNDYLGISSNSDLWDMFMKQELSNSSHFMPGSCSSRLLTGNSIHYSNLEVWLANLYKRQSALVFNSGYHANIGILQALSTKRDLILADKLVHASIIDGLKLCEAKVIRYKHNDLLQVEEILSKSRKEYESVFIVTESVFSMDGDLCNLKKLTEIKHKYNTLLYVDEAHAIGVFGDTGCGLCEREDVINDIDFIVGTFGKSIASQGAFLVCDSVISEYLINTMRSLIFTTALPSISLLWTSFIFEKITQMKNERSKLLSISQYFRQQLANIDFLTCGESQIVPVIIGENSKSVAFSNHLQSEGLFVLPVRPPTVPEGTARLRFSLNARMEYADIDLVINGLNSAKNGSNLD